jgi:hypothetical protein
MARRFLVVAIALMALLAVVTSVAAAEAPRWEITSVSSPTNLEPNSPRDEVQDLTVSATGGTFTLGVSSILCNYGTLEFTAPIPFDASASELQSAIEGVACAVGSGGVTVTGGPGGASPYVVTFVGERADRVVGLMKANGTALTGGSATASVTEAVRGAYVPYLTMTAINVGGAATDGSTITLDDALPSALTARGISGYDVYGSVLPGNGKGSAAMNCSALPTLSCSYSGTVTPGDMLIVRIPLDVAEASALNVNDVAISGGGAAAVSLSAPVTIGDIPAAFGPAPGGVVAATSTNQAGAHPNITGAFTLATSEPDALPAQPKDLRLDFPPGLVGNTVGMPRCTMARVLELKTPANNCPSDTMVGMAAITISLSGPENGDSTIVVPVYNIAPATGEPAAFGFDAIAFPVRLDTSVLSNGDYGVRVTAPGLTQVASTLAAAITIWGVPADHSGPGVDQSLANLFAGGGSFGGPNPDQTRVPLLTNPQQCSGGLSAVISTDAWPSPGDFVSSGPVSMGAVTGCGQLSFGASLSMLPDTLEAGAPAGYSLDLGVPQNEDPDGLATPDVKKVVATLPLGAVISPSAADGLGACSSAEFGLHSGVPGECPRDSQVGTVVVHTPALSEPLGGAVYLAEPECDPCTPEDAADGRMVRLLLQIVGEGESGVVVKTEGRGLINQQTGQLTAVFENDFQLPFSDLKLTLGGGERAVLANPRTCGPVSTVADLTPWSTPYTPDATPTSSFNVDENCFGPQFDPSFTAGTTNNQAGESSPFTLAFGRSDADEFLNGLQLKMPPGLLGVLSKVSLCREPQAAEGVCGGESLIGHVSVETGPGADPFVVNGGQVFITGPYKGAPYGLSIVVPAKAGPYTLAGTTGKGTVVVRAAISVDLETSALTITADPLPTILDGIPLQLRRVDVTVDRPGFTFNPTDCGKLAITGTLTSTQAASVGVSSPFQVTNCGTLAFKPRFTVSTSGKTSRVDGASLDARLVFPQGEREANVAQVKVQLPKQLPSRLPTLQKACTAAVFEANPANCPAASVVGVVKASTPILTSPLSGPVYFVSHGGEAFPSLIMVLQGEGVRVDLVGSTFISKGVTSTTLKTVPDVPVSSFELYLPEGPTSALTTDGVLCKSSPVMPTTFVAQNGAETQESVKIAVTGCGKKTKAKASRAKARRAHRAKASKARAKRARRAGEAGDARRARRSSYDRGRKS